jgi:hypothetical protein
MPKSSPNPQSNSGTLQLVKSQSVPTQEVRFRAYELYELGAGAMVTRWTTGCKPRPRCRAGGSPP